MTVAPDASPGPSDASATGLGGQAADSGRPPARPALALRLAAVLGAALLIWLTMGWLHEHACPDWPRLARHAANAAFVCTLAVPMVLAARRWLDRRPLSGLGLAAPATGPARAGWPLLAGALAWLLPATVGAVVCLAAGWAEITVESGPARVVGVASLLVVLVFVFEALPEELIFRGYLYRNLSARVAPWLAVAGQAVLFTAFGTTLWVVNEGWSVLVDRAVLFAAFAVVLGCLRVIAGNLWAPIGYHLAMQVVAQLLMGDYAGVEVRGEAPLTLVAFAPAFVFGPLMLGRLVRTRPDWRHRVPDRVGVR